MARTVTLTRNNARKTRYAALAAEGQDKAARNSAIEAALGEGAANVAAHDVTDGSERVCVGYEDGDAVYARRPKVVERKKILAPPMPAAPKPGSRARRCTFLELAVGRE